MHKINLRREWLMGRGLLLPVLLMALVILMPLRALSEQGRNATVSQSGAQERYETPWDVVSDVNRMTSSILQTYQTGSGLFPRIDNALSQWGTVKAKYPEQAAELEESLADYKEATTVLKGSVQLYEQAEEARHQGSPKAAKIQEEANRQNEKAKKMLEKAKKLFAKVARIPLSRLQRRGGTSAQGGYISQTPQPTVTNPGQINPQQSPSPSPEPTPSPTRTPFSISIHNTRPIWSGSWWPESKEYTYHLYGKSGPLAKYDKWTGSASKTEEWEQAHHSKPSEEASGFQGHCDGFSVSSILYPEPKRAVLARKGSSSPVRFGHGDVKGLLAALWEGYAWESSKRAAGGRGSGDLSALDFHKFLLFYIFQEKEALVVNIAEDPGAVWNYPCDGFCMVFQPDKKAPNRWNVSVTLDLANDDVQPDYLGRKPHSYSVEYWVSGKDPADWKSGKLTGQWKKMDQHPWWIFCPILNTGGPPEAPPVSDPIRHHLYADTTFKRLVEGLALVSGGQSNKWQAGEYEITVAAEK